MPRIYGVNTVKDSLRNRTVSKLLVLKGFKNSYILDDAKKKNIPIEYLSKEKMDQISKKGIHQGVIAEVVDYKTYSLSEVMNNKKDSVIVILDELSDPHNLGAILRSSDIFKVDAIIYKKNNSVSLSPLVAKISTGAINYVKCVEVTNLTRTINELKENGYWVIGLDGSAKEEVKNIYRDRKLVIVVGSEGFGISRLVKENCDVLLKIPQFGHVNCLNASVACSIVLYEIRR